MIIIKKKESCCGCASCAQICPTKAIVMETDAEGFLYPVVNRDFCTMCGLCNKACPVLNTSIEVPRKQLGWIIQHKNERILAGAASGGAFTAIAEYTLSQGGVVFGAVYTESFEVVHTYTECVQGLMAIRGSKYTQSRIGNSFLDAKGFLDAGRTVCFSGTPCQIEGLVCFLGKIYDNLILVDVVCHAVPSPLLWMKYVEMRRKAYSGQLSSIHIRDKSRYGYLLPSLTAYDGDKIVYCETIATDPYLRAFFSNICDRPSCYQCKFKKRYRVSDLTLWDCFEPKQFGCRLHVDSGLSCVISHSERGARIMEAIHDRLLVEKKNADDLANSSKEMTASVKRIPRREQFFDAMNTMNTEQLFHAFFPITAKRRIEKYIRIVGIRTGLYLKIKRLAKMVLRNYERK